MTAEFDVLRCARFMLHIPYILFARMRCITMYEQRCARDVRFVFTPIDDINYLLPLMRTCSGHVEHTPPNRGTGAPSGPAVM